MRGKLTQVLCHAGFSLFRSESLYVETPRNSPFPRETEQKKKWESIRTAMRLLWIQQKIETSETTLLEYI